MNNSTDTGHGGYQPAIKVHSPAPEPPRHRSFAPINFLPIHYPDPKKPRQAELKPGR